jgi:hypothetical protein
MSSFHFNALSLAEISRAIFLEFRQNALENEESFLEFLLFSQEELNGFRWVQRISDFSFSKLFKEVTDLATCSLPPSRSHHNPRLPHNQTSHD